MIPRFDTLTSFERDSSGSGISFGDFAANLMRQPNRRQWHRHDYFELFYFEHGTGMHRNDFQDYPVASPALVFVNAGHVHAWPESQFLRGRMLSFDAGFIWNPGSLHRPGTLFLPPAPVVLALDAPGAESVGGLFRRISAEWEERREDWREALRACLQLVLIEASRVHAAQAVAPVADRAADRVCRGFLLQLEQCVSAATTPRLLAGRLGLSTDHLSAVLREVTGKSAGRHIQDRLNLEARRLLAHSQLDVAEIAWHLGFADVSYFGRVFRQREGMTPGQFRKLAREGQSGTSEK